jgi:hydrogenase maturation protease
MHALEALYQEPWPKEVVFADNNSFAVSEFGLLKDYAAVLVLDGVYGGGAPGTVYRMDEAEIDAWPGQGVSLAWEDLLQSLYTAELFGHKPELRLVGMEPADQSWGISLSSDLTPHFPTYIDRARQELQGLLPVVSPGHST